MSFGSTSGRGFESEFASYFYGALLFIAVVVWVIAHFQIRKWNKENDDRNGRDD